MSCSLKNPIRVGSSAVLCQTCRQFIQALSDFYHNEGYPDQGWEADEKNARFDSHRGLAFKHQPSFEALASSAPSCQLCHLLHDDFASEDPNLLRGWLALYPLHHETYPGENRRKGYFRAGFSDSLARMNWNDSARVEDHPQHTYRIGRLRDDPVAGNRFRDEAVGGPSDGEGPWGDAKREVVAVPPRPTPEYIARRYEDWVATCQKHPKHERCRGGSRNDGNQQNPNPLHQTPLDQGELPTRVVDLGPPQSTESPRLYTTAPGEKAPYVALSHCWGGAIPSSTVLANLEARMNVLPVDELPRNFRDALTVTRALGIRYLWIDSLCIIQNSPADWLAEASKMAMVYAGAAVVVSAPEAPSSTAGFLHPDTDRVPRAILNEAYAVQKAFKRPYDYLQACPLNRRAWCMQERFLARRVLHFGREQLYWECAAALVSEAGDNYKADGTGHVAASFVKLRRTIHDPPAWESEWNHWYKLLEEYTTRSLTVGSDKLPALAGAASLTRSRGLRDGSGSPTYVAGLWREDVARGLMWGAWYDHAEGRKSPGYADDDKCSTLVTAPAMKNGRPRAPSWSWASVDGAVIFWALRVFPVRLWDLMLEELEVVMEKGEDALTEAQPVGVLKVRGPLASVVYYPRVPMEKEKEKEKEKGEAADVGCLTFADEGEEGDDARTTMSGCYQ
ncbi:heterokaryon incompatibility protein-domain-containing protein [Apiospora marii]|uniref:heterokaryon incompatibility protein-domain-containing protein n=1 Tax=Apiospora marii TaxID=335849 RepID=UPI00312EE056